MFRISKAEPAQGFLFGSSLYSSFHHHTKFEIIYIFRVLFEGLNIRNKNKYVHPHVPSSLELETCEYLCESLTCKPTGYIVLGIPTVSFCHVDCHTGLTFYLMLVNYQQRNRISVLFFPTPPPQTCLLHMGGPRLVPPPVPFGIIWGTSPCGNGTFVLLPFGV